MSDPTIATIVPATEVVAPATTEVGNTTVPEVGKPETAKPEIGKWAEQVSPEHRDYEFLKGKSKLDDLVLYTKSREEEIAKLNEKVKTVLPPKPAPDASPEEVAKWREANGLPKSADEIVFDRTGDLKDFPENKEVEGFYKKMFFEHDIKPEVAKAIWANIALKGKELVANSLQARIAEKESATAEFKKMYGQDYEANMKTISDFAKKAWGDETWAAIEASGLGNKKDFLAPLLEIGKEYAQGRFLKSAGGSQDPEKSHASVLFPGMK